MPTRQTNFARMRTGDISESRSARQTNVAISGAEAPRDHHDIEMTATDNAAGTDIVAEEPRKRTDAISNWPDRDLLLAFRAGEERAFAELYNRHKADVYTYCVRMLSGDEDAASDAFQEVFIKVYEKADQFRVGSNVGGWLFMIARNTCLNVFRMKRPCETLDIHPDLTNQDRALAPEFDQEQNFLRAHLERAIADLPLEFREPFILREYDGFSYGEIAEMTGTSLGITKVRIHRAKQKLRETLRPFLRD